MSKHAANSNMRRLVPLYMIAKSRRDIYNFSPVSLKKNKNQKSRK